MKNLICFSSFIMMTHTTFAWTLSSSTNSSMKGWPGSSLVFHLNPANCRGDIRSLINSAFDLWNSIPTSQLKLELGSDTSATSAQAINGTAAELAVITCDAAFSTTFPGSDPDFVAGNGGNFVSSSTNQITRGALVLNSQAGTDANINSADENSAKIIVAHEIGHVLGLGHSSEGSALMYYSVGYKTSFALSEDDENGMSYLYPRKEVAGADELLGGCGLIKVIADSNTKGPGSGPLIIAFLFLLPLISAFGLRRKKTFVAMVKQFN